VKTSNLQNSISPIGLLQPSVTTLPPETFKALQPSETVASKYHEIASKLDNSVNTIIDNRQQLTHALDELKRLASNAGWSLGFAHDEALGGPVITVSDLETGQLIRQIPTEVVIRIAHSIEKMKGLLFDKSL